MCFTLPSILVVSLITRVTLTTRLQLMVSGMVKTVLADVFTDYTWKVDTERATTMKESASYILENLENRGAAFNLFSEEVHSLFEKVLAGSSTPGSNSFKEKLWSQFHAIRLKELPTLWSNLCDSLHTPEKYRSDHFLIQHCCTRLFENAVKTKYPAATEYASNPTPLTDDEENALRYVAGYTIRSLIRKKKKLRDSNQKKFSIIACLDSLNCSEGNYDDYFSYTKAWLDKVDRGGLHVVNDEVYLVFKSMEIVTRHVLTSITKPQCMGKRKAVSQILSDNDVQFHWSLAASKVPNDVAEQVLEMIAELYMTIRGFALAAMYMEEYKKANQATTTRKKH